MKNKVNIKSMILGIILGILVSGVTVYTVNISSNIVEYDNTNISYSYDTQSSSSEEDLVTLQAVPINE